MKVFSDHSQAVPKSDRNVLSKLCSNKSPGPRPPHHYKDIANISGPKLRDMWYKAYDTEFLGLIVKVFSDHSQAVPKSDRNVLSKLCSNKSPGPRPPHPQ